MAKAESSPVVAIRDARLSFAQRTLWTELNLAVQPGEFVAVLGPNGSGKSTLLKVLLGIQQLSVGSVDVLGQPAGRDNSEIGYIPQQRAISDAINLRGTDLVGLGVDGHRWGTGWIGRKHRQHRVQAAINAVGAREYADEPIGRLSGGEQQRLRVAQALVGEPKLLLCDEPLLSLDLAQQRIVSSLIDNHRRQANTAVLFVTHEINPILPYVDRVLYLVNGAFRIGMPDAVMNSETLSQLYRTRVEVIELGGQLHIAGAQGAICEDEPHHVLEKP